jgi:asparagine synthase (glutamine-hydrolysing)
MCGVVGGVGEPDERGLRALDHRGPDASGLVRVGDFWLGHARLAILDLDARSNQPFKRGRVVLAYNGELWNYRELRAELAALGEAFHTTGDTEVVAAALDRWGTDALWRLNGMFAIAWHDGEVMRLARDRFGEVPLHYSVQRPFRFASELKALRAMGSAPASWRDVGPGEVVTATTTGAKAWRWYDPPARPMAIDLATASRHLRDLVDAGSTERAISDVPVCTLLSGGIDSAAVAACLARSIPNLVAFTAVMDPRSPDLRSAREVAERIGVELREVRIPVPSGDDLVRVVEHIEQPFKAQVEIGWACLVLADAMRAEGFRVTFSGEGSDELWASYGFAYHALKKTGWHAYRKELFLDQARKNFARCNKVFMARSIECRLPFLHPPLVEFALCLPASAVQAGRSRPKAVLQDAFAGELPERITRRPKLAFQDGLGLKAAIAETIADPRRFYAEAYTTRYGLTSR